MHGFPKELGSDNGKELHNKLIENYLNGKNIIFLHGMPYNPHSQGVVERFHKTVKDSLYWIYLDNPKEFEIKESLDIIIKKYNNQVHSSTKHPPNQFFYSEDDNLFEKH